MSTLADAMLAWKAKLTTQMTPEQVLTLRSDVNVFVDDVRFLEDENAKLRELVWDMWHDGMCECDEGGACAECEYHFPDRMRELGVDV